MKLSADFETFKTLGDPVLEKMKSEAVKFCAEMIEGGKPRWISFLGKSGAGKTFISRLILGVWNRDLKFYKHPQCGANCVRTGFFQSWRSGGNRILNGEYGLSDALIEADFLVLDDFSAVRDTTGICREALDRVADARVGKWTVLADNKSVKEIAESVDTRIASRLLRGGSVVVGCNTKDFNLRGITE